MSEEKKTVTADPAVIDKVDSNGDGHISHEEMEMNLEFKMKRVGRCRCRKEMQCVNMTWFALMGMLLYPAGIFVTSFLGQEKAATIIGDIAPTYFVAISALVAALVQMHM